MWSPRDAADVAPSLRACRDDDGWRVSGIADFVADADLADVIVVTGDADGPTVALVVDMSMSGIAIQPVPIRLAKL